MIKLMDFSPVTKRVLRNHQLYKSSVRKAYFEGNRNPQIFRFLTHYQTWKRQFWNMNTNSHRKAQSFSYILNHKATLNRSRKNIKKISIYHDSLEHLQQGKEPWIGHDPFGEGPTRAHPWDIGGELSWNSFFKYNRWHPKEMIRIWKALACLSV